MRTPSSGVRNSLAELVDKYHTQIKDGGAEDYLAARGINRRAIDRFKLGSDGQRLVIPYLTPTGPWQLKYRCVADHDCKELGHGKYAYDDGAQQLLFNAQTLLKADRAVITEGELDAITVEMAGAPCVAYPGADTWKTNRFWAFCFDSCDEVIVVADGDEPGEKAAVGVAELLRSRLPDTDVRKVSMPPGMDANSYVNSEGQMAFLDLIGWI